MNTEARHRGPAPGLILVGGSLLYTFAFFMAMPLLSLVLAGRLGLSAGEVGLTLAICPLVSSVLSPAAGALADRCGARALCLAGAAGFAVAYTLYGFAARPWHFQAIGVLVGCAKAAWDPAFKSLLATVTPGEQRAGIFRYRYAAFCVGAVGGPMVGALLFGYGPRLLFLASASFLWMHTAWLLVALRRYVPTEAGRPRTGESAGARLSLLAGDPRLLCIVATGFMSFSVFSLFESVLPLAIQAVEQHAVARFSSLLVLNAVLSIALQIPLTRIGDAIDPGRVALVGCVAFALSFAAFVLGSRGFGFFVMGTVLFAVAEAAVYPSLDILVERAAPAAHRAAYFGTADLKYFGFACGPAAGGWLLGARGAAVLFACAAAVSLGAAAIVATHHRIAVRKTGCAEKTAPC